MIKWFLAGLVLLWSMVAVLGFIIAIDAQLFYAIGAAFRGVTQ